jgi:Family of unknown function (DUF5675)
MIQVIMKRAWEDGRATIGMLTVVGVKHDPIFTLENPKRPTTKDDRTPAGFYKCEPYSSKKHPDVYILKDVPGRTYILFHVGNYERDTLGCILLGSSAGMAKGEPAVLNSVDAFKRFRQIIGKKPFDLTIV